MSIFELTYILKGEYGHTMEVDVDARLFPSEEQVDEYLQEGWSESYKNEAFLISSEEPDEDFFELAQFCSDNPHFSEEAAQAAVECGIDVDHIEESYMGEWDNDEEFAEELFSGCYEIPDFLQAYIDWESVAGDVMMDHVEEGGHYFRWT